MHGRIAAGAGTADLFSFRERSEDQRYRRPQQPSFQSGRPPERSLHLVDESRFRAGPIRCRDGVRRESSEPGVSADNYKFITRIEGRARAA